MTPSVTENASLIVIDWGTTNRRAYLLDENGNVLDTRRDDRGILNLDPKRFAESFHEFIKDWRDKPVHELPVLMSGMIGSRQGWHEAPYVTCPVRQDDLVSALLAAPGAENCSIVPGVSLAPASTRHDVMRGEEVQIFGAIGQSGRDSGILCLPGTHSKWAKVENGQLVDFTTAMTVEVFQVLRDHSILGALMNKTSTHDKKAFLEGVDAGAGEGGLLAHLFAVRANGLFGRLTESAQTDYLSGLLIGHEVRSLSKMYAADAEGILVVGSEELSALYGTAMTRLNLTYQHIDGAIAAINGMWTLWPARHAP